MPHTLVMGNLLSTDLSTLYLDAGSGFDVNLPITVVAVVTTRLGNDIVFKELGPSAVLSNFSVPQKLVGDAPFVLTAPTSNSTGAFTYSSSNPAVATVSGTTVTIVGSGTTTITATQAATATHGSNSITATFNVLLLPTLSNFTVPQKVVGDAPFALTAPTSNSTGAFTYISSNPVVATVSGTTVTIVGSGTTTITATQAATATYASNSINTTFTVQPNSNWVQRGLDIDGEAAGDLSGYSVSISSDGNVVAIGAYSNDGNGSNAGHVRVYAWNETAWVQRGLDIDGEAPYDNSGRSVSISSDGNVVAIGASGNDGNGSGAGHVRVYAWNGTAWVQRGLDIDGKAPYDYSGSSVSISSDGNVVAIGANSNTNVNGIYAGHVRVYYYS